MSDDMLPRGVTGLSEVLRNKWNDRGVVTVDERAAIVLPSDVSAEVGTYLQRLEQWARMLEQSLRDLDTYGALAEILEFKSYLNVEGEGDVADRIIGILERCHNGPPKFFSIDDYADVAGFGVVSFDGIDRQVTNRVVDYTGKPLTQDLIDRTVDEMLAHRSQPEDALPPEMPPFLGGRGWDL